MEVELARFCGEEEDAVLEDDGHNLQEQGRPSDAADDPLIESYVTYLVTSYFLHHVPREEVTRYVT